MPRQHNTHKEVYSANLLVCNSFHLHSCYLHLQHCEGLQLLVFTFYDALEAFTAAAICCGYALSFEQQLLSEHLRKFQPPFAVGASPTCDPAGVGIWPWLVWLPMCDPAGVGNWPWLIWLTMYPAGVGFSLGFIRFGLHKQKTPLSWGLHQYLVAFTAVSQNVGCAAAGPDWRATNKFLRVVDPRPGGTADYQQTPVGILRTAPSYL